MTKDNKFVTLVFAKNVIGEKKEKLDRAVNDFNAACGPAGGFHSVRKEGEIDHRFTCFHLDFYGHYRYTVSLSLSSCSALFCYLANTLVSLMRANALDASLFLSPTMISGPAIGCVFFSLTLRSLPPD
jgi:hypothetical protein